LPAGAACKTPLTSMIDKRNKRKNRLKRCKIKDEEELDHDEDRTVFFVHT
jgi:hypothetical protein